MRLNEKAKKTLVRIISLCIAVLMFVGIFIFALMEILG